MNKFILLALVIFIFSLYLVEAETIVTGKIYNSTILIDENSVADASVEVKCYHLNSTYTKETISVSDGTYGVGFDDAECGLGDNIDVTAYKNNLKGSNIGLVHYEAEMNISVVNVVIQEKEKIEKKIHKVRKREFCGDLICGNSFGEDKDTCPEDCLFEEIKEERDNPIVEVVYLQGYGSYTKIPEKDNKVSILTIVLAGAVFIVLLLISIVSINLKTKNL